MFQPGEKVSWRGTQGTVAAVFHGTAMLICDWGRAFVPVSQINAGATAGLSRGTTEFAQKVWRDVEAVAEQAPQWVRDQINQQAREAAREMKRRMARISR